TDAPLIGDRVGQNCLKLRTPPLPLCGQRIDVDPQPMIVAAPHAEERQQGRIDLDLPAVGWTKARVESDRQTVPSLGFSDDEDGGRRRRAADRVSGKLIDPKRVLAFIEIAITDVSADLPLRPGNQGMSNVEAAIKRA